MAQPNRHGSSYCPNPRKREYIDRKAAEQSAFSIYKKRGYKLRAYQCQCGMWHLATDHLAMWSEKWNQ